jgi:hypothetical protein
LSPEFLLSARYNPIVRQEWKWSRKSRAGDESRCYAARFLDGVAVGVGGALAGGVLGDSTLLAAAALDDDAPEKSK